MDLSIDSWNVGQVTDMRNMFAQVTPFKSRHHRVEFYSFL